ncbi:MAG: NTP/NDP exchange transporter, partial [Planctomycetota bacterium]
MHEEHHESESESRDAPRPGGATILSRVLKVEPGEGQVLAFSCAYFFCVLCAYYLIRPIRDAMGVAGGIENLKWLYLGTLSGTLMGSVAFAAIAARYPRRRFIPFVYRFFTANLLIFFVLISTVPESGQVNLGRAFFVWVSVFVMFVVSVFWSFMADVFTNPQGKRLFAFIAVGGTFGQICGSFLAGQLAPKIGAVNLLLASALLLEVACWCVHRLNALARRGRGDSPSVAPAHPRSEQPLGGNALEGFGRVMRSGYLLGICLFMFLYTITSTLLVVTKLDVGAQASTGRDARVVFFANFDFWSGVATILAQVFLTSRLIAWFGVGLTIGILPVVTVLGFAVLGVTFVRPEWLPVVGVLITFEAVRRATNFAVSRPAREVLYIVVSREDKYKSKNLIDTFVYRFGDQVGVWAQAGLASLGAAAVAASPRRTTRKSGQSPISEAVERGDCPQSVCASRARRPEGQQELDQVQHVRHAVAVDVGGARRHRRRAVQQRVAAAVGVAAEDLIGRVVAEAGVGHGRVAAGVAHPAAVGGRVPAERAIGHRRAAAVVEHPAAVARGRV